MPTRFLRFGRARGNYKTDTLKILTPHPGDGAVGQPSKEYIEKNRRQVALEFAREYDCVVLLKGHRTLEWWRHRKEIFT